MSEHKPSQAEIEYMLAGIKPKSVSPDAVTAMTEGIKSYLRAALQDEQLTDDDIQQLRYAIDTHFYESVVTPGEPVGVLAGTSMGEPSTQMALNSHRYAGVSSKTTNEGIPRLQELLRVSERQRAVTMQIYFNTRKSLQEVRNLSSVFVSRDLNAFIDRARVLQSSEHPEETWHQRFRLANRFELPQPAFFLRLELSVSELRRFNLTLVDIVERLQKVGDELVYIYSPTDLGLIDVYAKNPTANQSASYITPENAMLYYLRDTALPLLRKQTITGVEGIESVFPRSVEVSSFIAHWAGERLVFDKKRAELNGVRLDDMIELLSEAGYAPRALNDHTLLLGKPGNIADLTDLIFNNPQLKAINNHWGLETNGSNLAKVLAIDDVNSEITYTSNVREVYQVFGAQAARDFLLDEYVRILSAEAYIDPRHLILLADMMANLGFLAPVTSTGVSRQKIGPLTRSAFEKPVEQFLNAAAFGESEKIRGVSASIYVGKRARIGDQAFLAPAVSEPSSSVARPPAEISSLTLEDVPEESQSAPPIAKSSITLPPRSAMVMRRSVAAGGLTLEDAEDASVMPVEPETRATVTSSVPQRRAIGLRFGYRTATSSSSSSGAPATSSSSGAPATSSSSSSGAPATSSSSSSGAPATSSSSGAPATSSSNFTPFSPTRRPPVGLNRLNASLASQPVFNIASPSSAMPMNSPSPSFRRVTDPSPSPPSTNSTSTRFSYPSTPDSASSSSDTPYGLPSPVGSPPVQTRSRLTQSMSAEPPNMVSPVSLTPISSGQTTLTLEPFQEPVPIISAPPNKRALPTRRLGGK